MEIEEILSDSESKLEREFDDLDLYSMDDEEDEENNNSAPSTRKRHAPRKYGSKRLQSRRRPSTDCPLRLTARHCIAFIPGNNVQKRCFVCSHTVKREKKRSDTRFYCANCDVPLWNPNCFKEYHTLKAF